MTSTDRLDRWFREEVLPLEGQLRGFIRRNWRCDDDVSDLLHDVYELAYSAAEHALPLNARSYLFAIARNHLINRAKRARIVSFDLVADLESIDLAADLAATERHLDARDRLRQVQAGLDKLSPRVREIVWLRKFEGLSIRDTADRLGIGPDAVNHQLMTGMKALVDHMFGETVEGAARTARPRKSEPRS